MDSCLLLVVFSVFMGWTIWQGLKNKEDSLAVEVEQTFADEPMPLKQAFIWLVLGLCLLVVSSRLLFTGSNH